MKLRLCVAAAVAGCLFAGCSGGGSNSTGGGSGGGTTTGPDLGTVTTVSDSDSSTLTNAGSGMVLGIAGASQTAGANVAQESTTGAGVEIDWHFLPMNNSQYNLENMLTHQLMGVSNASTSAGTQIVQWADNGTKDHLWEFYQLSDGNDLIQNVNSSLYLEVNASGGIDQAARAASGSRQEWKLASTGNAAWPSPANVSISYAAPDSPVIGIHDPSMLAAGTAYDLFSTHGLLHEHLSTDLVTFSDGGFALASLPAWAAAYTAGSGDLWAPDASAHNGEYWLYYAASSFGSDNSAIGLAVSSTALPGSFVDSGAPVYTSSKCPGSNAIDPASVVDAAGNAWLAFGSWSNGIQIVPVDSGTGIPTGAACTQLASHPSGTGIEGSSILLHGGSYYLFASIDNCCGGVTSTYRIIVGRSSSVTGPYTDRGGIPLTQGGGTIVLSAHGNINGPGGESLLTDSTGPVLVYHYYDGNNNGDPALGINRLGWTSDGWPYVQ